MSRFKGTVTQVIGAFALFLVAAMLPAVPTAEAAVAPWTWKRVTHFVSVEPHSFYSIRVFCPAGYTAITGGLGPSRGGRNAEYRFDDASGSSWFIAFENSSAQSYGATLVAECVETADLPPISHHLLEFATDGNGRAEGIVGCLNQGEVVLTGGVDWSNVNTRWIDNSGPAWNGEAWIANGYNSVAGAKMGVEVYCVDPAYVPGYQRVETEYGGFNYDNWQTSVTCPSGTRILNGGTQDHIGGSAWASYPSLNRWTATGYHTNLYQRTYIRAWCVNAGTPTVALTNASPGPEGVVTRAQTASFALSGSDPAGFPNGFQCSLNGSPLTSCSSSVGYGALHTGTYQFVARNTTADGRNSSLVLYNWTVDRTRPTVTRPQLPTVTLGQSVQAGWTGSDAHSGIDHYQAKYWLAHADGTTTGWTQQPGWSSLASPSVQTPNLAQGESLCLSVRAHDEVGNRSRWTAPRCTSRPLDDRALTASTGWTRATGSNYWLNTITQTTASAQTLRRTGVHLSRVGVVATECPTCGVVDIKVGTTTIGSINLAAAATAHRRTLLLPAFTEQIGAVTVQSTSSGKPINIDGLVVIQTTNQRPT